MNKKESMVPYFVLCTHKYLPMFNRLYFVLSLMSMCYSAKKL